MSRTHEMEIDCIAMKRRIQEEIAREMQGMTRQERLAYLREQVGKGPFAAWFPPVAGEPTRPVPKRGPKGD